MWYQLCVHSEKDDSIGRMFYCVKSHQKFKILDTFNSLMNYYVMLLRFALRPSIVHCKQSQQKIGIFRRSAVLINRLNDNIFLCFYVFGPSLGWFEAWLFKWKFSLLQLESQFQSTVQYRKWSRDRKWSPKWTANDPRPQVIPKVDRKWSRKKNRNDLDSSWRIIESILLLLPKRQIKS